MTRFEHIHARNAHTTERLGPFHDARFFGHHHLMLQVPRPTQEIMSEGLEAFSFYKTKERRN